MEEKRDQIAQKRIHNRVRGDIIKTLTGATMHGGELREKAGKKKAFYVFRNKPAQAPAGKKEVRRHQKGRRNNVRRAEKKEEKPTGGKGGGGCHEGTGRVRGGLRKRRKKRLGGAFRRAACNGLKVGRGKEKSTSIFKGKKEVVMGVETEGKKNRVVKKEPKDFAISPKEERRERGKGGGA